MRTRITILLMTICFSSVFGQVKENEILQRDNHGTPKLIKLKETEVSDDLSSINKLLKEQFKTNSENKFIRKRESKTENEFKSEKLQQHYKGIKVEYAIINIVSKNGKLKSVNGKYIPIKDLKTNPSINEEQALNYVLNYIGANKYAWEDTYEEALIKRLKKSETATYYPKGELVVIEKNRYSDNPIPTLAYKFDVYALKPASRQYYYVDANTGEVFYTNPIMRHVEGIASTRYSGQRTIETEQINGQFRLKDNTRGNGITTYNNFNQTSHTNTHYLDNDNNWTVAEYDNANRDNSALDAHWGSMMTYDYFSQIHNRNSIDNNGYELINYVNANLTGWNFANSDNAFWNGSVMTYGMGTNLDPIVSIDVIAHEIGHGLNDYTANLTYERESGALDEGLSDIWGAMVEFFAAPEKDTYSLGEDLGQVFRSMSNPKLRNQPDTYRGINWRAATSGEGCTTPIGGRNGNDYCGVHTNSGVLNHWFYLLAEGSSATDKINDNGDTFSITGIGKLAASRILYRAETTYFTPTTDYHDARDLTIQAAEDLYGVGSIQAATTCQSWFAVGVGDNNCNLNIELTGTQNICGTTTSTYTLNYIPNTVSWSTSSNLQILSSNANSVTVKPISLSINGTATITVIADGISETRAIWVGKPDFYVQVLNRGNYIDFKDVFLNGNLLNLSKQGIYSVTWQKISGSGNIYASPNYNYQAEAYGSSGLNLNAKVTVSNSCGSIVKYFDVVYSQEDPCDDPTFDGNTISIGNCDQPTFSNGFASSNPIASKINVYDFNGRKIISASNAKSLDIKDLSSGIYIVKIQLSNGKIITKKILK